MKDPLDNRDDAYQLFNDEAKEQRLPIRLSLGTRSSEIRPLCSRIKARSKKPQRLQAAWDKLTRVELRMEQDIYYYWLEHDSAGQEPLVDPGWEWETRTVPLPEMPVDGSLVLPGTDVAERSMRRIEFRTLTISPITRYDDARLAPCDIVFEE